MTVKPTSQCGRVLAVLADGRPHTVVDIHRRAGTMRLNSRVAELRNHGHDIVCERVRGRKGPGAYRYTWLNAPPQNDVRDDGQLKISTDEIAPRVPAERYRLFRVKNGGPPEIVATVATPEAIGAALLTLGREGEFDDYCLGIMDTFGDPSRKGEWVIRPWQKGI